jgi:hypothetical protein
VNQPPTILTCVVIMQNSRTCIGAKPQFAQRIFSEVYIKVPRYCKIPDIRLLKAAMRMLECL